MKIPNWLKRKPKEVNVNLENVSITPNISYVLVQKIDSWIKQISIINNKNTIETKVISCKGATGNLKEVNALIRIFNQNNENNYVDIKCPRYRAQVSHATEMANTKYDMCYCFDIGLEQKVVLRNNEEPSDQGLYKCPYAGKFE